MGLICRVACESCRGNWSCRSPSHQSGGGAGSVRQARAGSDMQWGGQGGGLEGGRSLVNRAATAASIRNLLIHILIRSCGTWRGGAGGSGGKGEGLDPTCPLCMRVCVCVFIWQEKTASFKSREEEHPPPPPSVPPLSARAQHVTPSSAPPSPAVPGVLIISDSDYLKGRLLLLQPSHCFFCLNYLCGGGSGRSRESEPPPHHEG